MIRLERSNLLAPLGVFARRYWHWWTQELSTFIPDALRERFSVTPVDLRVNSDGIDIASSARNDFLRFADSPEWALLDPAHWQSLTEKSLHKPLRLILTDLYRLEIGIVLPKDNASGLRRIATLQLPTVSPLEEEHMVWAVFKDRQKQAGKGQVHARLVLARADYIEDVENHFAANGLMPPDIAASVDGQIVKLKANLRLNTFRQNRKTRVLLLLTVVSLLSIPVTTVALADYKRSVLDARIAQMEGNLSDKMRKMAEQRKAAKLQQILGPVVSNPPVSGLFESLAEHLPTRSFVLSAEQKGSGDAVIEAYTAQPEKFEAALVDLPNHKIEAVRKLTGADPAQTHIQAELFAK